MKIIEQFSTSAKGDKTEDLIVETPGFFGVFDGVTGVKADWLREGRTMGQWGSFLAGEALKELPPEATLENFAVLATQKIAAAKKSFGLGAADRLASTALILPKRRPLEIWSIGDSHYGYRLKDGSWHACVQNKYYDSVTTNYRHVVITQEVLDKGLPQTQEQRAALIKLGRSCINEALSKQMLWANHPDPAEKLGFGVLTGTTVPAHHRFMHRLPDDTAEVVLCSDGLPEPMQTAAAAKALLAELRTADPLLLGKNRLNFIGIKGFVQGDGTIAACYDDVSYVRIAVL
jgi:serine/threonine protein phosphatase PrpC